MNDNQTDISGEYGQIYSKPVEPNKLLRLALIASEQTVSDYSIFLEHLLAGLADESIPVVLVCPPNNDMNFDICGSVEVIRHPALQLPLTEWLNRKRLVEQLAKFKPNVLHCLCESRATLTRRLARQLRLPYVMTVNSLHKRWSFLSGNFSLENRGRLASLSRSGLSISTKRCASIIASAKTIAENFAAVYPRFAERIEQINIGTFTEESTGCFRESSRLAILMTAQPFDKVEDFENIFNAIKHLSIDGYEFMMVVIGSGRAEKQLRALLVALGLSQIVTIVPKLKPWRAVIAAGDIFIQPKPSVNFNPLLLEAMSVGAAIAACKGGVDDLIIEDKTAVVFDPKDVLSIKGSLQRLLDRPEFSRKIAKAAQQYLRDNYTVSNMISATIQTYRKAQQ